ncbi:MAG: hypothetical protein R3B95_04630 [Nitrospirales bacterium]|nr:hypothetical protein [Nitrospirales bacterium]
MTNKRKETYQEDPFARYLVGLLYDITGDLNNAYVGYRKAEQVYEDSRAWSDVVFPDILKADLIRTAERLGLSDEAQHSIGGEISGSQYCFSLRWPILPLCCDQLPWPRT